MRVNGDVLIACNCDWGCPCNFNARPSKGFCEGGWIWLIENGQVDDVPLGGLGVAVFAKWPGAIHEGGGRATCYLDAGASASQRDALSRVLRGELGGPWGIFINTYELEAIRPERFELQLDGVHSTARVGDAIALEMTTIKNPVTGAEVHPGARLPEGIVFKEGDFGSSTTYRLSDEVAFEHPGKYTAVAPFDYSGP